MFGFTGIKVLVIFYFQTAVLASTVLRMLADMEEDGSDYAFARPLLTASLMRLREFLRNLVGFFLTVSWWLISLDKNKK